MRRPKRQSRNYQDASMNQRAGDCSAGTGGLYRLPAHWVTVTIEQHSCDLHAFLQRRRSRTYAETCNKRILASTALHSLPRPRWWDVVGGGNIQSAPRESRGNAAEGANHVIGSIRRAKWTQWPRVIVCVAHIGRACEWRESRIGRPPCAVSPERACPEPERQNAERYPVSQWGEQSGTRSRAALS